MQTIKVKSRRIKFWFNLTNAYLTRYKFYIIFFTVFVLFFSFFSYKLYPSISRSNLVTIGFIGNYTIDTIPTEILQLATDPLIAPDASGKPVAKLASHWQVADEGKTYIVFLKDNLIWHDQTNINAKDISIAISNVQITALNNKAIEFKLPNPIASFPLALNKPVFKTKSFYGTGEFKITDIDSVDNKVKQISLNPKNKSLPRVHIKFYQTQSQAINALKIGEIKNITLTSAKELENWPNLETVKNVDESQIVTIFYNTQDSTLSSKDLRQALTYSINRAELDGKIANSPISTSSWAISGNVKKYEYNTGKAKELITRSQSQDLKITLSTSQELSSVANQIKKDWEAVGFKVQIKEEKEIPTDFQALLVINKLNPDPDQYNLWHSSQTKTNISKLKDVKIDKLLEDARNNQDEAKRKEFYEDFQKSLTEDAPATFLYHPYKYTITYKNIKNLIEKLPKN